MEVTRRRVTRVNGEKTAVEVSAVCVCAHVLTTLDLHHCNTIHPEDKQRPSSICSYKRLEVMDFSS